MPTVKKKAISFKDRMKEQGITDSDVRLSSLWDGPENSGPNGGVTQSLISRACACSERFRLKVIEGLSPVDTFSHRMEYGNLWHTCEESHAKGWDWKDNLIAYVRKLGQRYRTSGEEITHWYDVCRTQFPIYVDYWSKHPDILKRTPLLSEQVFHVPYILPSGRTVYLRGKWDSVDLVEDKKTKSVWLVENKSKGDINEQQIVRQLSFDLQSLFYFIALTEFQRSLKEDSRIQDEWDRVKPDWRKIHGQMFNSPIAGVRYNVIRRPLSGGKHTIRQHQPTKSNPAGESKEEFYTRLGELIKGEPEFFFMRWNVRITEADVERFKREFLNPFLENLCDLYEWWSYCKGDGHDVWDFEFQHRYFPDHCCRPFRLPFGCYNPVQEGVPGEYDEMLATGSTSGLTTATDLFRELR